MTVTKLDFDGKSEKDGKFGTIFGQVWTLGSRGQHKGTEELKECLRDLFACLLFLDNCEFIRLHLLITT